MASRFFGRGGLMGLFGLGGGNTVSTADIVKVAPVAVSAGLLEEPDGEELQPECLREPLAPTAAAAEIAPEEELAVLGELPAWVDAQTAESLRGHAVEIRAKPAYLRWRPAVPYGLVTGALIPLDGYRGMARAENTAVVALVDYAGRHRDASSYGIVPTFFGAAPMAWQKNAPGAPPHTMSLYADIQANQPLFRPDLQWEADEAPFFGLALKMSQSNDGRPRRFCSPDLYLAFERGTPQSDLVNSLLRRKEGQASNFSGAQLRWLAELVASGAVVRAPEAGLVRYREHKPGRRQFTRQAISISVAPTGGGSPMFAAEVGRYAKLYKPEGSYVEAGEVIAACFPQQGDFDGDGEVDDKERPAFNAHDRRARVIRFLDQHYEGLTEFVWSYVRSLIRYAEDVALAPWGFFHPLAEESILPEARIIIDEADPFEVVSDNAKELETTDTASGAVVDRKSVLSTLYYFPLAPGGRQYHGSHVAAGGFNGGGLSARLATVLDGKQ